METFDISQKSVMELKSMAYDIVAQVEVAQRNLQVLNQEIAKKQSEKPGEMVEPQPNEGGTP